jgi:putative flippase GtrA
MRPRDRPFRWHSTGRVDLLTRHGFTSRFSVFSLIGAGVFFAGLALQVALVRYCRTGPDWSYAAQAVFSIELSYLLNRYLTWRDRTVGFWAAAWKFNAQKALMTVINMAAYALLVRVGMEYVVANVLLTAISTPINYFAGDLLVFARGARGGVPESTVKPSMPAVLPAVSVVIPCKASERTIRATVESFLTQEYPALAELILVGDVDDSTWTVLDDINDPRLILIEQERTPGRRDPNVKRDKGITKSSGDVIALADSDIVVDPGWIGRAVALLNGQGGGLVAGGMRSIHETFWGRFVDNNVLAAKTPRVARPYQVTAESFGARGHKPPVTANAIFTRTLYDECPLDVTWAYGYEDYEWFWRLAKEGHAILFSSDLTAAHHHRRSFRHLVREYRQSAYGCAQFIRAHPDSPLARKRTMQAFGLPAGALAVLGLGALAVVDGYGVLVAGALAVAAVLVTGREVSRVRSFESLTYPAAGLALGGIYAASIAGSLLIPPATRPAAVPTWDSELDEPPRRRWRDRVRWPLMAILAVQAGLSSSLIWSNTAFSDEALYLWAGHVQLSNWFHPAQNLPSIGTYNFADYFSGAPQFYPVIAAVADSVGGLAGARLLSLAFMMGATLLLYSATARVFGQRAGLIAALAWIASESAIRMGAYATYDPMAIFLVCLGAWLAIQSGFRYRRAELIALSALTLVLASVTAYSYVIYVPVVALVAVFAWAREGTWKRAVVSGAWLSGMTGVLLIGLPTILKLWHGIFFTTISRSSLTDHGTPISIVEQVWSFGGWAIIAAIAGAVAVAALAATLGERLLAASLACSILVVPVYQSFDAQTGWALDKHMTCGIWLGAIAIGGGLSRVSWPSAARGMGSIAFAAAALFPIISGWYSAYGVQLSWPNETGLAAAARSLLPNRPETGYTNLAPPYLDYYTLPDSINRLTWVSTIPLNPVGSQKGWLKFYRAELNRNKFGLIVLVFPGSLKSSLLPGAVFRALISPSQQQLVQVASTSSSTPGLYYFKLALDADRDYRAAASGPYDSGFGYGTSPWTFVIYQRENPVQSAAADVSGL